MVPASVFLGAPEVLERIPIGIVQVASRQTRRQRGGSNRVPDLYICRGRREREHSLDPLEEHSTLDRMDTGREPGQLGPLP